MRRTMVAGNWKMNCSRSTAKELLEEIVTGIGATTQNINVAVFPPFVHIPQAEQILTNAAIGWGGQNLSQYNDGAYTGEISGDMLKDFGCKYVLVGHSERRALFHETNEIVAEKFAKAQSCALIPILCVGETLAERDEQKTFEVIEAQIQAVLSLKGGVNIFKKAIIAYEPVWAIGTGLSATPDQAEAVHKFIRTQIANYDENIAAHLNILYGGSVKVDNAAGLFEMPNIDGALIGGAALKATDFLQICQMASGVK